MDVKFAGLERTTPEGVYRVLGQPSSTAPCPLVGSSRGDIAADLGISRSPLREALSRLEEEGLVVKIPFRGAFVVEVSAQDSQRSPRSACSSSRMPVSWLWKPCVARNGRA